MIVLLVEPDRLLARTYRGALERAGHRVLHAVSAQQAVQVADETTPEVVVLEVQLPRHNGVEFLYEFRSYSEWLHIPIVIQTYVPPSELQSAATLTRELGVRWILHKPVTSLRQLCEAVQRVAPAAA
jgi:DNA-binding response OmpR family regulator